MKPPNSYFVIIIWTLSISTALLNPIYVAWIRFRVLALFVCAGILIGVALTLFFSLLSWLLWDLFSPFPWYLPFRVIRCDNSGVISGGSPSVGESSIYVEEETFAIAAEFFTASLAVGKSAGVHSRSLIYGFHVYYWTIYLLLLEQVSSSASTRSQDGSSQLWQGLYRRHQVSHPFQFCVIKVKSANDNHFVSDFMLTPC